jgi:NitT/TauT family transport system substrate-binding protein
MFKMTAWMRWIGLAVAALTLTIACSKQPNQTTTTTPTPESKPLVSTTMNWIGHSSYYVALKKGLFADAGLKVEDLFLQSGSDLVTAFMSGKADIGWLTSADAVQMVEKDPSVQIIYLIDYSNGADGILGRNIKSPQDIKGKTIARENILYEKVFLQAYLKKAGLTEKDVKIKDMLAADAATAFAAKKVDAAVAYEPYLSKIVKAGGGEIIFSTKNTNLIADAIAVRKTLIQTRKPELQAYLKAVDKAVKLINAGNPEALKIASEKMGASVDDVKAQLTGVKLFDLDGNKTIAFNKTNSNSIIGNLELTAKSAAEFKIISKPIELQSLYDASVVESITP